MDVQGIISDDYLDTLFVQCKLKDSVCLESCCKTWNRLLVEYHPGHHGLSRLSFILRATSDTLSTPVSAVMACIV